MGYCPKCEDEKDGDVQWHRSCFIATVAALIVSGADPQAYRYHPKE